MDIVERIGRRIKLQDLHVLMTVAQAGSMGKAAQRLSTSQPAISRSIAGLEHALGVRLLERTAHGVAPTDYGRALLEGGGAAFDELLQAVKKIEFLADPASGEVRVGSTVFTAASFVAAVIDRLSRRYPNMRFQLTTASWEELHAMLGERKVDFLITRRFDAEARDRLDFEFLFDESFVVVAGARSPLARLRKIELRDLAAERWVLPPPGSMVTSIAMRAFAESGVDYPRAAVQTLTPDVRMSLVATGRFVTIFPASMMRFSARRSEIKVLPVRCGTARVPTGIVTLRDRSLGPAAKLFIEDSRQLARRSLTDP